MKIRKQFGLVLTANFQSYTFTSEVELEYGEPEDFVAACQRAFDMATDATFDDIRRLAERDPDFETVFAVRKEGLADMRKQLAHKEIARTNVPFRKPVNR